MPVPVPHGASESDAFAIDDAGDVTGTTCYLYEGTCTEKLFVMRYGSAPAIYTPPKGVVDAEGVGTVNDTQAPSYGSPYKDGGRAALWDVALNASGKATVTFQGVFNPLPGDEITDAFGVNSSGVVVGDSEALDADGTLHAVVWSGATATNLTALEPARDQIGSQYAYAVNSSGQIVAGTYLFYPTASPPDTDPAETHTATKFYAPVNQPSLSSTARGESWLCPPPAIGAIDAVRITDPGRRVKAAAGRRFPDGSSAPFP